MLLPFNREAMRERNRLDEEDDIAQARRLSPSQRLAETLELSDLCFHLAVANGVACARDDDHSLEEKAKRWAAPLRLLARK